MLAIIVFHTSEALPGGYLTIDAFFVLSGYLITTLLIRERARSGRVRLGQFYARRARRLLPALLLVVAGVALVDWLTSPADRLDVRRSDLMASLFYYANWHFISVDEDYFALYEGASPLRHIWSLGVEEQYYLLWPLLVIAALALFAGRLRPLLALSLGGAALSALAMAMLYDPAYPERAYFGTDARAHQLLIGGALAVLMQMRPGGAEPRERRLAAWLGPLAAAAAVAAVLVVPEGGSSYYYGGSVLFASAVAISIWSAEVAPRGLVGRALSLPPLVWAGLISYGLYLWHWPLVVWLAEADVGRHERQALIVAGTFALAALSFYLVERPVREGRLPWVGFSARRLALAVPLAFAVAVAVSLAATRLESGAAAVAKAERDWSDPECPAGSPRVRDRQFCARTAGGSPRAPVVVVAGDSTARALDPGMRLVAARRGWRYVRAGQGACPVAPFVAYRPEEGPAWLARRRRCPGDIAELLAEVSRRERPDVWIVADRHGTLTVRDGDEAVEVDDPRHGSIVRAALRRALSRMTARGAEVVILRTPPPAQPIFCVDDPHDGRCRGRHLTRSDPATLRLNRHYRALARELPGVTVISIDDLLCPGGGVCPLVLRGRIPRWDSLHFTSTYSREVVPAIIARAERAGVRFRRARARRPAS